MDKHYSVTTNVIQSILNQFTPRQLGMFAGYVNSLATGESHIQQLFIEHFEETLGEEDCRNINRAVMEEMRTLLYDDSDKNDNKTEISKFFKWCRIYNNSILQEVQSGTKVVWVHYINSDTLEDIFPAGIWLAVTQQGPADPDYVLCRVTDGHSASIARVPDKAAMIRRAKEIADNYMN